MNSERARQIVSSPDMVNVTYGNARVYMETVNDSDQTCTVHYLDDPGKQLKVPLSTLTEQ